MEDVLIRLEICRPVRSFGVEDQSRFVAVAVVVVAGVVVAGVVVIFGRLGRIVLSLVIIIDGVVGDYAFDAVFGVGSFIVPYPLWRTELLILLSRILQ